MVVVHGPLLRQVLGLHGVQEVLAPAALQLHECAQASLAVALHHLQPVWNELFIKNPAKTQSAEGLRETAPDSLTEGSKCCRPRGFHKATCKGGC